MVTGIEQLAFVYAATSGSKGVEDQSEAYARAMAMKRVDVGVR
jgi:hypothetical protein